MGRKSAIEWTNATWNPWRGCKKVSDGCKNCYMFRQQRRFGLDPTTVVRAAKGTFYSPTKWSEPSMIFTCSWSDFFIEEADPWREEAWEVIRRTRHHTYQILTKRPENIAGRLPEDWGPSGYPNVWLSVTVESAKYLGRLDTLLEIPAAVRFVSAEPLLGPLGDIRKWLGRDKIGWVIVGGESGPGARAMQPEWVREIRKKEEPMKILKINTIPEIDPYHSDTNQLTKTMLFYSPSERTVLVRQEYDDGATLEPVWRGRLLACEIPHANPRELVDLLLDELAELFHKISAGYSDKGGKYTEEAWSAWEAIQNRLSELDEHYVHFTAEEWCQNLPDDYSPEEAFVPQPQWIEYRGALIYDYIEKPELYDEQYPVVVSNHDIVKYFENRKRE